jgi:hypothetical protein
MMERGEAVAETLLCVRLKPHVPRAGQVLRHYCYRGILFRAGAGWSKVSESVAAHLRGVRQQERDPYSPLAFDVCSESEARALDAKDAELSAEVVPVERARRQVARDEPAPAGSEAATPATALNEMPKDRPSARAKH